MYESMNEYSHFDCDFEGDNEIPEQEPRITSLPTAPAGRPFMGFHHKLRDVDLCVTPIITALMLHILKLHGTNILTVKSTV